MEGGSELGAAAAAAHFRLPFRSLFGPLCSLPPPPSITIIFFEPIASYLPPIVVGGGCGGGGGRGGGGVTGRRPFNRFPNQHMQISSSFLRIFQQKDQQSRHCKKKKGKKNPKGKIWLKLADISALLLPLLAISSVMLGKSRYFPNVRRLVLRKFRSAGRGRGGGRDGGRGRGRGSGRELYGFGYFFFRISVVVFVALLLLLL